MLRALQEGEIEPVGSARVEKVNVRVISATNRRLLNLAKSGEFREDLVANVFGGSPGAKMTTSLMCPASRAGLDPARGFSMRDADARKRLESELIHRSPLEYRIHVRCLEE